MIKKYFYIVLILAFSYGELITPNSGDDLNFIHVLFEWEQEPNTDEYNLQVSNQSSFNTTIIDINEGSTVYIEKEALNWSSEYFWRVRPIYINGEVGNWSSVSSFSINEKQFPEIEADIYNDNLIQDGLVAFSGFAPTFASAIIDKYGNEIWNTGIYETHTDENFDFLISHINKYGNIYGMSLYDHPNNTGTKINYNREFIWSAPTTDPTYAVDIHEIKQIPNGNYMAFVPDYRLGPIPEGDWTFLFQMTGYQADGTTDEFYWRGMRIVEWDEDGNEIWSWDPFEHFTMDDTDLYGGTWWASFNDGFHDWMHSNAFHFDENESVIYVSHRHLSRISKIAYPSGQVIWNIGMPAEYGTGDDNICTDLGNSFQHNIQMLEDGSLLFFDNGNLSQMLMGDQNPTSRIRRIRVIDNSYCETEWEYELPPNLFGLGMGSAQLLDNGNYLLYTYGNGFNLSEPTLREVTSDHEVVWNYQGINSAAWYRTYKIPSIHPDAFSVIADGYTIIDNNETIQISSNSLNFIVHNKSGYTQPYKYIFSDLIDGGNPMFSYQEGELILEPYESVNLSFPTINNVSTSTISLSIWPSHHDYASKELIFPIAISSLLLGDVNSDGEVNILDVVTTVDLALNSEYNYAADTNQDGEVNVLDIVIIVSLILN